MKIITDFRVLLKLAYELGQAKKSGDITRIAQAKKAHDNYKEFCLRADGMITGLYKGDLLK